MKPGALSPLVGPHIVGSEVSESIPTPPAVTSLSVGDKTTLEPKVTNPAAHVAPQTQLLS